MSERFMCRNSSSVGITISSNFQSQGAVSDNEVDLNVAVPGDECSTTVKVMSSSDVISSPVVGCVTKSFKTGSAQPRPHSTECPHYH